MPASSFTRRAVSFAGATRAASSARGRWSRRTPAAASSTTAAATAPSSGSSTILFPGATGADIDVAQTADCARRLTDLPLTFTTTDRLAAAHAGAYDVVTCMEVLEHCLDDERRRVVAELARLVRPGGVVVVSVPIEVGPSLAGKQIGRAIAAWRGLGDYRHRETYGPLELVRMIVAMPGTSIHRPSYSAVSPDGTSYRYYGHKGFDWRVLREELKQEFVIRRTQFSPMPRMRSLLNSQVWFVCERR